MKFFGKRTGVRVLGLAALSLAMFANPVQLPARAQVSIGISVGFAPPALPVYEQPLCPGEGYIWTPGYWAWDPDYGDYYWVPGTWVPAPQPGYLWTPPWWGWNGVAFIFHEGYWGRRVGFYGGVDYGYGYTGRGYYGGRWEHDHFYYNRSVNNVNVTQVRNVYNTTVVNNVNVTRVSYNGGNGGVQARATPQEEQAQHESHVRPVLAQQQHFREARRDRALRASDNHGKPPIAATVKPAQFRGDKVVAAKAGNYTPQPNRETDRAPNAKRPAANQPNVNRPGVNPAPLPNTEPNTRPNANRLPEKRSDRPPHATKPAPTPNAPPNANNPASNANRREADRPAPNVNPKTNENANPNRPEANRPAPRPNPPRANPNTPNPPPNAGHPNSNERGQQVERMRQQDQQRQRAQQQQNQEHARAEQQQRANNAQKQQEQRAQRQQQQEGQQPKAQPRPQPKPQEQPKAQSQQKQKPPKQQEERPQGRGR